MNKENFNKKLKYLIGLNVIVSFIWLQFFELPPIIGIITSSTSLILIITILRQVNYGKENKYISEEIAKILTILWFIFLPLELITFISYAFNAPSLGYIVEIFSDVFYTISEAFR